MARKKQSRRKSAADQDYTLEFRTPKDLLRRLREAELAKEQEAAAKVAEERKKAEAAKKAATEEAKWHNWTNAAGKQLHAKFGGVIAGTVKLIKPDGTTVRVPLKDLSDEDRDWIKKPNKTAEKSNGPPAPKASKEVATTKPGPPPVGTGVVEAKPNAIDAGDGEAKEVAVQKPPAQVPDYRTWTDSSGEHKIEAKYGGLIAGKVKLVKQDGTAIMVPLEKLSDEDQAWIKNRKR